MKCKAICILKLILGLFICTSLAAANGNDATATQPRIFQIGFNKCGTLTLADFFWSNNIKSVHYDNGIIAVRIHDNYVHSQPLLYGLDPNVIGFFDMEMIFTNPPIFISQQLFKKLDQQYPGSKFILNTRDKEAWLKSRSLHMVDPQTNYLEYLANKNNVSNEEMLSQWSREWDEHHKAVLMYFKDRPDDLLVYNIETDKPEKIVEYFKGIYKLDASKYQHLHKTTTKNIE